MSVELSEVLIISYPMNGSPGTSIDSLSRGIQGFATENKGDVGPGTWWGCFDYFCDGSYPHPVPFQKVVIFSNTAHDNRGGWEQ